MKIADMIRDLHESGASIEVIIIAVRAIEGHEVHATKHLQKKHSRQIPKRAKGAFARHGYDGPQTARLSDKEWKRLRTGIIERDNHTCVYCGDADAMMVVDHIVPLSRGGTNEANNLATACFPCNSSKRDLLLTEWTGRLTHHG